MSNSRFAMATHILSALAQAGDWPLTSEELAQSVNTNPVVIRRILGLLRKAGLVASTPGVGGGTTLARDPQKMTLLEVYDAINDEHLLCVHSNSPSRTCPIGANIHPILLEVFWEAESAMKTVLAGKTIAEIGQQTMARAAEG